MKICQLHLHAFGHFQERLLDFSAVSPGLHIIFGQNEAGKSTTLRALKALLYGFPERTSDNFLHASQQLLLGGCLENNDGRQLAFQRRKRRKADLLDVHNAPLPPSALDSFLHGVDERLFETLYAIDHPRLVQGGRDILMQHGELGQALFAAGAGIASLQKIAAALQEEAEALYTVSGRKKLLNESVNAYRHCKSLVKERSLPATAWLELQQKLAELEKEQSQLEEEITSKRTELRRLEILQRALPEMELVAAIDEQIEVLGEVRELPLHFADEVHELRQQLRESDLAGQQIRQRQAQLQQTLANLPVEEGVLAQAEAINFLHQRLGAYLKSSEDRNRLEGMRINERRKAASLLQQVRPDLSLADCLSCKQLLSRRPLITRLVQEHQAIAVQIRQSKQLADQSNREEQLLQAELAQLSAPPDSSQLHQLLRTARSLGDGDRLIEKGRQELDRLQRQLTSSLRRIGLWNGDLVALPELPLPLMATVRRFAEQLQQLDNAIQQRQQQDQCLTAERQQVQGSLDGLQAGGHIPSEQSLQQSRQQRQRLWQQLRSYLPGQQLSVDTPAAVEQLLLSYEEQVRAADTLADRLRWEAERVGKIGELRARGEQIASLQTANADQQAGLQEQRRQLVEQWQQLWQTSCIEPLPPAEMLGWLADMEKLRQDVQGLQVKQEELAAVSVQRDRCRAALADEMTRLGVVIAGGEKLAPLVDQTEKLLESYEKKASTLEKVTRDVRLVARQREQAEGEMRQLLKQQELWRQHWQSAAAGLDASAVADPAVALGLLDTWQEIFLLEEKAAELQSRIQGIDRDAAVFAKDAQAVLEKTSIATSQKMTLPEHIRLLQRQAGLAQQNDGLRRTQQRELEQLGQDLAIQQLRYRQLQQRLAEMTSLAGCQEPGELDPLIQRAAQKAQLQEKRDHTQASCTRAREGLSVNELEDLLQLWPAEKLTLRQEELRAELSNILELRHKEVLRMLGEVQAATQRLDGGSQAADSATEMATLAAKIERQSNQYLQLKLAAAILQQEIERYRQEHQDPLLQVAAKFFQTMTLHAFTGLSADVNEQGQPVLIGEKSDGRRVGVGGMSSGTCDQLYLALRLAALQERSWRGETFPFIVDDILINFDDRRAKATLEIFAELALCNQILLFTHHQQILHEAEQLSDQSRLIIHHL